MWINIFHNSLNVLANIVFIVTFIFATIKTLIFPTKYNFPFRHTLDKEIEKMRWYFHCEHNFLN